MQTRIALGLCIVAGSALIGRSLTGAARRRAAALRQLLDGAKMLRIHMISMFEPVQNALTQSGCAVLDAVGRAMGEGRSAGAAWQAERARLRRTGGPIDALKDADMQILDGMFAHLGQSGREAQEILLAGAIQSLERQWEAARAQALEADKLYISLGLLVGLMLALIVL